MFDCCLLSNPSAGGPEDEAGAPDESAVREFHEFRKRSSSGNIAEKLRDQLIKQHMKEGGAGESTDLDLEGDTDEQDGPELTPSVFVKREQF